MKLHRRTHSNRYFSLRCTVLIDSSLQNSSVGKKWEKERKRTTKVWMARARQLIFTAIQVIFSLMLGRAMCSDMVKWLYKMLYNFEMRPNWVWLSVTETVILAWGQSLTLLCLSPERHGGWGRQEGSLVQVRCLGEVLLFCSSLSDRQREAVLQCHYSSTQASGNGFFLTLCRDTVVETALAAKGWLGTLLTAYRQTHPDKTPGCRCPWVLMRIQHFLVSSWAATMQLSSPKIRIFISEKARALNFIIFSIKVMKFAQDVALKTFE